MKLHRALRILSFVALVLFSFTSGATALPLGDELLAPAVPRSAPRSRPELSPQPAIFSSRQVLYVARSADGTLFFFI